MVRTALLIAILAVSCDREPVVDPPATTTRSVAAPDAGSTAPDLSPPEPWRVTGTLLGATSTRAIVLADEILSIDIETGAIQARASTIAEDPTPSFDRNLPRFEEDERAPQAVKLLDDLPVYVGGEVVVFMRGADGVVTSLVGLDTTTLEEAWRFELAYKAPPASCRTDDGVLLIPDSPQPARFVNWLGQQAWLREFGRGKLEDFRCGEADVQVLLETGRGRYALRTFEGSSGDLLDEVSGRKPDMTMAARPSSPGEIQQVGGEVVRLTSRN